MANFHRMNKIGQNRTSSAVCTPMACLWPECETPLIDNAGTSRQSATFAGPLRLLKVMGSQILLILEDKTATLRLSHPKEDQPALLIR